MAERYRQRYLEAGDVLEPRDWVYNMAELAAEFNGNLDTHNLPANAISEALLGANAAGIFRSASSTTSLTTIDNSLAWWPNDGAASPVTLGSSTFTTSVDSILICEFSAWWAWDVAAYTGTGNTASQVVCIRFRITVDGYVVAESGPFEEGHWRNNGYICGSTVVQAGTHTVRAEYQKFKVSDHNLATPSSRTLSIGARELITHVRYR